MCERPFTLIVCWICSKKAEISSEISAFILYIIPFSISIRMGMTVDLTSVAYLSDQVSDIPPSVSDCSCSISPANHAQYQSFDSTS